jgi:hypothetical protein
MSSYSRFTARSSTETLPWITRDIRPRFLGRLPVLREQYRTPGFTDSSENASGEVASLQHGLLA